MAGASGAPIPRFSFRELLIFIPRFHSAVESLTFSAERLGWRYRNARGSYTAVCTRDFPMQGDVAPKAKNCSCRKLSTKIALRGRVLFALPSKGDLFLFSLKVFGILKTFFQKGFKQVRTESATFVCEQSPRPYIRSSISLAAACLASFLEAPTPKVWRER